jgi:predicted helicase
MTGVSINLFIKKRKIKNEKLSEVFNFDLYGKRNLKYPFLFKNSISSIKWNKLKSQEPYYFFIPRNLVNKEKYEEGFSISKLIPHYNSGIQSKRDKVCISFERHEIEKIVEIFKNSSEQEIQKKYDLPSDGRDWKITWAKEDLRKNSYKVIPIQYRIFDFRYTAYTGNSKGFIAYPRHQTNFNIINKENIALITVKQQSTFDFQHALVSKFIIDGNSISMQTREYNYSFPLYLYPEVESKELFQTHTRTPNLSPKIIQQIAEIINLRFTSEIENTKNTFAPIDLLDYIYAILYSPSYRERYKEFLKIDFPRVPYPKDATTFWQFVALGSELRQFHLMEHKNSETFITSYPKDGNNIVTRKMTMNSIGFELVNEKAKTGKVWINDEQYFDGVPLSAWEFYIGGYQPAQKWLKDRHGRELDFDDILHYQKIIVALVETERLMGEINKIELD